MLNSEVDIYDVFACFMSAVYRYKFGKEFDKEDTLEAMHEGDINHLLDTIRHKTWHRTIHYMNTLPSSQAIHFQSLRVALSLFIPFNATLSFY